MPRAQRPDILTGGDLEAEITAEMLPREIGALVPSTPTGSGGEKLMSLPLRDAREVFEREYLVAQINRFGGNISRTAEFIGMDSPQGHDAFLVDFERFGPAVRGFLDRL